MIPYSFSETTVTVFLGGVPYPVDKSHPNWDGIMKGLQFPQASEDELLKLVSVRKYVESLKIGCVTVADDAILYNGEAVHNHLTQRMLEIVRAGLDVKPWANFMDNLMKNPSKTAVDELYLWLERSHMPITEDGFFLAYKKVRDDYCSFHDSKFENKVGTWVEMPRNQVDDNRQRTCSYGLHFCSWDYLPHYFGSSGRVVVVKINPADVVSIPSDYDNAKGRAHRYFIFGEIDQQKAKHAFADRPIVDTGEAGFGDDGDYENYDEQDEETNEYGFSIDEWRAAVARGETTESFDYYAG